MKFNDARSFKALVMADYFMNPGSYPRLPDASRVYEVIRDSGYGMIKMPPMGISSATADAWVVSTVDQIQEYSNRGFRVAILGMSALPGSGIWLDRLDRELKKRGLKRPDTEVLTSRQVARDGAALVKQFLEK